MISKVVWEETTARGASDSAPMKMYDRVYALEKRGSLDFTITGHKMERPAEVLRGEESDRCWSPLGGFLSQMKATPSTAPILSHRGGKRIQHCQCDWIQVTGGITVLAARVAWLGLDACTHVIV